jgi:hypothetical protein
MPGNDYINVGDDHISVGDGYINLRERPYHC